MSIEEILFELSGLHSGLLDMIEITGTDTEWADMTRWRELSEGGWKGNAPGTLNTPEYSHLRLVIKPLEESLEGLQKEVWSILNEWKIYFGSPLGEAGVLGEHERLPDSEVQMRFCFIISYAGPSLEVLVRGEAKFLEIPNTRLYLDPPLEFKSGKLVMRGSNSPHHMKGEMYLLRIGLS